MKSELEKIASEHGDVSVRKKKERRKRQKLLLKDLLLDYAKSSPVQGLRYIFDHGLNIIEKVFWFATVVASIVVCSYCIKDMYYKWISSPVIVTVNGHLSSVASVPFPAVTICPQIKVKSTVYNYTKATHKYFNFKLEEDALIEYIHISSRCERPPGLLLYKEPGLLTNISFVNDITKVALESRDILLDCSWYNNTRVGCTNLFSKVYTDDGVCYTANSLAAKEIFKDGIQTDYRYMDSNRTRVGWTPEGGYDNNLEIDSFPRRGRVLGNQPDMQLILRFDANLQDKTCNIIYSGYKIYLQHPADFPQSSFYYYAARPNEVASVAISFHKFDTDTSLLSYAPELRQCYFQSERPLRYFKMYTAKNCQAECLSNFTLKLCNCVGYYMPHNDSTQICSPYYFQIDCMSKAKDSMALQEIKFDLEFTGKERLKNGCDCLPACNTIEYDAEILKSEYNINELLNTISGFDSNITYSQLDFFFKQPQFVTMQRRELFGVIDLLANIGGLLGVFLGFSFLSLIELFYFLTLKIGFVLKRDLEEEKCKVPKCNSVREN